MDKWDKLIIELTNWKRDAQTKEEEMILKIVLDKMEVLEKKY
jgi:hypothetical protein